MTRNCKPPSLTHPPHPNPCLFTRGRANAEGGRLSGFAQVGGEREHWKSPLCEGGDLEGVDGSVR